MSAPPTRLSASLKGLTATVLELLQLRLELLSVEAQDIGVAWSLAPLFNKQLRLGELNVASLKIDDQRSSADTTPLTPPTDLRLPITLDVPFKVASLSWTGATTLLISHDVPQCMAISDWVVLMATGGRIVAQGTPAELMASAEPEVRQFVRGEPDGPVKFHYPAPPVAVDFGLEASR